MIVYIIDGFRFQTGHNYFDHLNDTASLLIIFPILTDVRAENAAVGLVG